MILEIGRLFRKGQKDIHGNTLTGNTYVKNTKNCYLRSEPTNSWSRDKRFDNY